MSFGLSGEAEKSVMIGGDVVVAWVDKQTLQGYAIDYFLNAKSQCSGGRGSCPDTRIQVRIPFSIEVFQSNFLNTPTFVKLLSKFKSV